MRVFESIDELERAVGGELGVSEWVPVSQQQVDQFAAATGDHQWIHIDAERARSGPFGHPVAHGFLTLALVPVLVGSVYRVRGLSMVVNYGTDRVRFPTPVPVGRRIRGRVELVGLTGPATARQCRIRVTVELEDSPKPACVAELITLLVP